MHYSVGKVNSTFAWGPRTYWKEYLKTHESLLNTYYGLNPVPNSLVLFMFLNQGIKLHAKDQTATLQNH